jgi:hypothetical protein
MLRILFAAAAALAFCAPAALAAEPLDLGDCLLKSKNSLLL